MSFQLPPLLDILDEGGEALGVEPVRGVEILERRLVDVDDRDAFKLQPVLRQVLLSDLAHAVHVGMPVLVHLAHAHLGRDRAHGAFELAREKPV
jgi:hypothetical protein